MYLKSTARNSVMVLFLIFLGALAAYGFRILLARNFSVEMYGVFYALLSFFGFFTLIIDQGIPQSAAKEIIAYRTKKQFQSIQNIFFTIGIALFVLSFVVGGVFVLLYFSTSFFENFLAGADSAVFFLFVIWFCTLPIEYIIKMFFFGFNRVRILSTIDVVKTLAVLVVSSCLFYFFKNPLAPIIAYASINLLLFTFYFPLIQRSFPSLLKLKPLLDFAKLKKIVLYGWFIAFSSIAFGIITNLDTIMLTFFRNTTEVGLYQTALPLANTILYVVSAINLVSYPMFSAFSSMCQLEKIQEGVDLLYRYAFVGFLPLVLVFLAFPDLLITFLFGSQYSPAANALRILSVGIVFYAISTFNITLLQSTGHAKMPAQFSFIVAIVNVVLNLILIPKYGFEGAAVATSLSFFLLFVLTIKFVVKLYDIHLPMKKWLVNFISAGITVLIIWFLKTVISWPAVLEFSVIMVVAAIFYSVFVILFRVVEIKEVLRLINLVIR